MVLSCKWNKIIVMIQIAKLKTMEANNLYLVVIYKKKEANYKNKLSRSEFLI